MKPWGAPPSKPSRTMARMPIGRIPPFRPSCASCTRPAIANPHGEGRCCDRHPSFHAVPPRPVFCFHPPVASRDTYGCSPASGQRLTRDTPISCTHLILLHIYDLMDIYGKEPNRNQNLCSKINEKCSPRD